MHYIILYLYIVILGYYKLKVNHIFVNFHHIHNYKREVKK